MNLKRKEGVLFSQYHLVGLWYIIRKPQNPKSGLNEHRYPTMDGRFHLHTPFPFSSPPRDMDRDISRVFGPEGAPEQG